MTSSGTVLNRPGIAPLRKVRLMTLALIPNRWKIRLAELSEIVEPSPIERLCRHEIWVRNQAGELICRNCQKVSG